MAKKSDSTKPTLPAPDPACPRCRGKGYLYRQDKRGRVVAVPCDACRSERARSWKDF